MRVPSVQGIGLLFVSGIPDCEPCPMTSLHDCMLRMARKAASSSNRITKQRLAGTRRFLWAQKGPSMLHAVTMTLVGLKVALLDDWTPRSMWGAHNELVSAFLALELAYLLQARRGVDPSSLVTASL